MTKETIDASVADTVRRLDHISQTVYCDRESYYRDVLATLGLHAVHIGQFEIHEKITDAMIGWTKSNSEELPEFADNPEENP